MNWNLEYNYSRLQNKMEILDIMIDRFGKIHDCAITSNQSK